MIRRYKNLIHWGGKEVMELSLNRVSRRMGRGESSPERGRTKA